MSLYERGGRWAGVEIMRGGATHPYKFIRRKTLIDRLRDRPSKKPRKNIVCSFHSYFSVFEIEKERIVRTNEYQHLIFYFGRLDFSI